MLSVWSKSVLLKISCTRGMDTVIISNRHNRYIIYMFIHMFIVFDFNNTFCCFFNLIVDTDSVKCSCISLIGGTVSGYVLSVILLVVLVIQNVWILKRR